MRWTPKSFNDGTHRTRSPDQTIAVVKPFLPAMGITRVANVTGLDRINIPVVNAFRPNSRSLSVSQGKGLTLEAAQASAIMEAIEGFHAENIDLPYTQGSHDDLVDRYRLINTGKLAFLSGTEFDRKRPILWLAGHDLVACEQVLVPSELVHTDYTLPRRPNAGCFVASTNGLASGNHRLEAVVHAICEVIERDAHTLWEHMPRHLKRATRVDLESVTDQNCRSLIKGLTDAGMKVGVWDMTSDVGVATFHCLITDERVDHGHSGGGAGTHLSRDIALLRALTEAVQVRTNYITGARDDLRDEEYELSGIDAKTRYANDLMVEGADTSKPYQDVPSQELATLEADLEWLITRLTAVGVEQVVDVDLSKSAFEIPVHRVIIPGLEGPHDHADYCPGDRARACFTR